MLVSRFASLCIKAATVTAGGDHFTVQTAQPLQSISVSSNDSSQTKEVYSLSKLLSPQVRWKCMAFIGNVLLVAWQCCVIYAAFVGRVVRVKG